MWSEIHKIGKDLIDSVSFNNKNNIDWSGVLKSEQILDILLKEPTKKIENSKVLIFNFFDKKLKIETLPYSNTETKKKIFYIGEPQGNITKFFITSKNVENTLNALYNLSKDKKFKDIFTNFNFSDFFEKSDKKFKLKSNVKLETDFSLKDFNLNNDLVFEKSVLSNKEIVLFTVKINDKFIATDENYRIFIINKLFDIENFTKPDKKQGFCFLCGQRKKVYSKLTLHSFKFYNTDKVGFSSALSDKYDKNFTVCKPCYQKYLIGEKFIDKYLTLPFYGLTLYVVPKIYFDLANKGYLSEFKNKLSKNTQILYGLEKFEKNLEDYLIENEYENIFLLNYLFVKRNKNEMKIKHLIKDIPPSRINLLIKNLNKISDNFDNILFEFNLILKIDFSVLYLLLPIKVSKNFTDLTPFLDLYKKLLTKQNLNFSFLIKQFLEIARALFYENKNYYITSKNFRSENLSEIILTQLLFIDYFNKVEILKFSNIKTMETQNMKKQILLPDQILDFWQNLPVFEDEQKRALFLLGFLMAQINYEQTNKNIKKHLILSKLNFQGITKNMLKRLINDITEKLLIYKLLNYPSIENTYAIMKQLMDKNLPFWNLSPTENTYFILSGYSYFSVYLFERRLKEYETLMQKAQNILTDEQLEKAKKLFENKKLSDAIKFLNEKLQENNKS